jgi:hypothetical protein
MRTTLTILHKLKWNTNSRRKFDQNKKKTSRKIQTPPFLGTKMRNHIVTHPHTDFFVDETFLKKNNIS